MSNIKSVKRSIHQQKIIKGLEKVWEKLLDYKVQMNTELVVIRNNEIVKVKPESFRKTN
jgi:hypothetical protein